MVTTSPTLSSSISSSITDFLNSSNYTTTDSPIIPFSKRADTFYAPVICFLILSVGVLGNSSLIWIIIKQHVIRKGPNIYIFSLAVADLLVILSCVPYTSTIYTFKSWPYGLTICKASEFAKDVSLGVSIFTLTALSADRFFAIVDPYKKLNNPIVGHRTTKLTLVIALLIWVFSIICATPAIIFSFLRNIPNDTVVMLQVCYPYPELSWPSNYGRFMVINKFMLYYLIPLTIIAIFYALIALHLIRTSKQLRVEGDDQLRRAKARRKIAATVLIFVSIFAICFLPNHVFMLWFYNNPNSTEEYDWFWNGLHFLGLSLSFTNSCINPIALYFVSGTFRKYFDDLLRCCGNYKRSHPGHQIRSAAVDLINRDGRKNNREESKILCAAVHYEPTISTRHPHFGTSEKNTKYMEDFAGRETIWGTTSAIEIHQMTVLDGKK